MGCLSKLFLVCVAGCFGLYLLSPSFRQGYDHERSALTAATTTASAPTAAGPPEAPVTVRGTGGGESETFALRGGDYRVEYGAGGRGYYSAALDNSANVFYARLFAGTAPAPGVAHVHGVRGASYFLRVTCSRCGLWSVMFTPE